MQSTGKCLISNKVFTTQCLALNKVKRQDIRLTKQISVTRISNLPSKFHVLLIFWRKGTFTGGGGANIVKKCPVNFSCNVSGNPISGSLSFSNFIRYGLTECKQCWLHRMFRDHVHLWITFVFVSNTCVSLDITKTSPEDHAKLSAFHALRLRFTIFVLVAWAGVLLVWKKYIDKRNI
jgi:hypothetical protein